MHYFRARVGLDQSRLLHTDIGSLLPISFRSLLIHVYLTRSVIVFCIGRALPIRHLRDIRNSSRYTLRFYFVYPLSITGQIYWHAWSTFRAWRTLALGFQCVDFCVNTSFGMLGGTRRYHHEFSNGDVRASYETSNDQLD